MRGTTKERDHIFMALGSKAFSPAATVLPTGGNMILLKESIGDPFGFCRSGFTTSDESGITAP